MRWPAPRWPALAALGLATVSLTGCETLGYYAQSVGGHLDLMLRRRPIEQIMEQPETGPELRTQLERALEMRAFAVTALALPDGESYRSYVDLQRRYVVWNVVAAPELSLTPRRWCYPVAGCVSYRGYFAEADARRFAEHLRRQDLDVYVSGARAYSTLGWFADPLLNTMLSRREYYLAGVIFHELAHQRVYVAGDASFNEAYAVAVEREGVRRWIAARGSAELRASYEESLLWRRNFFGMVLAARSELLEVYRSDRSPESKRRAKAEVLDALRARHGEVAAATGERSPYERWFARDLNNAKLAQVATYQRRVPAFEALLRRQGGDMAAFHQAVERIAGLDEEQRAERLDALEREVEAFGAGVRQPA